MPPQATSCSAASWQPCRTHFACVAQKPIERLLHMAEHRSGSERGFVVRATGDPNAEPMIVGDFENRISKWLRARD